MPSLVRNDALEVRFDGPEEFIDQVRVQVWAVRGSNQGQRVDLHLLGQNLDGADTGHLMSLLDATDVSAARCQQHVLLN